MDGYDPRTPWRGIPPVQRRKDGTDLAVPEAVRISTWNHCIEKIHTTTPLSYRDYTGTIDGSAYGIVKNYQYPQISFVSTRTKLKNLFLTGQNLNVHGALGVTLTAMLTCSEFVGQEYLAKKVGNA